MPCPGTKKATNQTCGSPLYRCKNCGNEGCNQGAKEMCSNQGFAVARCQKCNKLGSYKPIEEATKPA